MNLLVVITVFPWVILSRQFFFVKFMLVNQLFNNHWNFYFRTKIFIRHAQTLFAIEDAFQVKKTELVSKIKAIWRGTHQRKMYLTMRFQVIFIQKYVKRFLAVRQYKKRKWACNVVRRYKFINNYNLVIAINSISLIFFLALWKASWPATKILVRPTQNFWNLFDIVS